MVLVLAAAAVLAAVLVESEELEEEIEPLETYLEDEEVDEEPSWVKNQNSMMQKMMSMIAEIKHVYHAV